LIVENSLMCLCMCVCVCVCVCARTHKHESVVRVPYALVPKGSFSVLTIRLPLLV